MRFYQYVVGAICLVAIGFGVYTFFTSENSSKVGIERGSGEQPGLEPATMVTVTEVTGSQPATGTFIGTVKSRSLVEIYPGTSAQIISVKAKEGQKVKKGQILFELGGATGTSHPLESQLELALASYNSAISGFNSALATAKTTILLAQLQLQSATHQAEGYQLDLQALQESIETGESTTGLLEDSLEETKDKNQEELDSMEKGIDNLEGAIDDLKAKRSQLTNDFTNKIDVTTDVALRATLKAERDKAFAEIDKQIKDLKNQLSIANDNLAAAESGFKVLENQLQGQLDQASSQVTVLELNQESLQTKLGLYDGSSDAVDLAQGALQETINRTNAGLIQAQSQLNLAKKTYEAALNQAKSLVVRAPVSGILGEVFMVNGDIASPQFALTNIVDLNHFELEVRVDVVTASRLAAGDSVEVEIADKFIKTPIAAISETADPVSRLVEVTLDLPGGNFKVNQTVSAIITTGPLLSRNEQEEKVAFFIPLDAVIIGTEEQYVFIYDNGKAKKVNVELGQIEGSIVETTAGLKVGDLVIVEGAKELLEDQTVTLIGSQNPLETSGANLERAGDDPQNRSVNVK